VATETLDFPVSGMTCAGCANTIERTLATTPGVSDAHVNFATSTATVSYDPRKSRPSDFVTAIEHLGYHVPEKEPEPDAAEAGYRLRLYVAIACAVPVMALGMLHRAPWLQLCSMRVLLSLPARGLRFATGPRT
jgi:Cu+-exporting ATPase